MKVEDTLSSLTIVCNCVSSHKDEVQNWLDTHNNGICAMNSSGCGTTYSTICEDSIVCIECNNCHDKYYINV